MSEDLKKVEELLAVLPDITLPESLTAESLWARVDRGELVLDQAPATPAAPAGKVIDLARRLRPVLAYAAVFLVMVVVYYGMGLEKTGYSPSNYAAPADMPVASSAAAAATPELDKRAMPDMAAAPQLAMDAGPEADPDAGQGAASSTAPADAPEAVANGPALMTAPNSPDATPLGLQSAQLWQWADQRGLTKDWEVLLDNPEALEALRQALDVTTLTPPTPAEWQGWPDGGTPIDFTLTYLDGSQVEGCVYPNQRQNQWGPSSMRLGEAQYHLPEAQAQALVALVEAQRATPAP